MRSLLLRSPDGEGPVRYPARRGGEGAPRASPRAAAGFSGAPVPMADAVRPLRARRLPRLRDAQAARRAVQRGARATSAPSSATSGSSRRSSSRSRPTRASTRARSLNHPYSYNAYKVDAQWFTLYRPKGERGPLQAILGQEFKRGRRSVLPARAPVRRDPPPRLPPRDPHPREELVGHAEPAAQLQAVAAARAPLRGAEAAGRTTCCASTTSRSTTAARR